MEAEAVVVGGGPAGLAAALWLARYRRDVVVLDSGDYRAAHVERSHGYLGRDPQSPMDLLARGREELARYPTARVVEGRATTAQASPLQVGEWSCRAVVLATGVQDALPAVAGIEEHYGASVFHCPSCDGYEAADRDVVCLGWDPQLAGFAATLQTWARSVTLVTHGKPYDGSGLAAVGVDVRHEQATGFVGERGDLRAVELETGEQLPASLVFFSVAHRPRTELATALGCALEDGYVAVDGCGRTSVPGVYAAGDVTPGLQLASVAAASGVVAGVEAAQFLVARDRLFG